MTTLQKQEQDAAASKSAMNSSMYQHVIEANPNCSVQQLKCDINTTGKQRPSQSLKLIEMM